MASNSCVILSVPKRVHRASPTKPALQGNNCSESSGRKIVRARIGARLVPYANSKGSSAKCKLRLLKIERVKDFLLLEEEFMKNQEILLIT